MLPTPKWAEKKSHALPRLTRKIRLLVWLEKQEKKKPQGSLKTLRPICHTSLQQFIFCSQFYFSIVLITIVSANFTKAILSFPDFR
jgi:hypothetical protein